MFLLHLRFAIPSTVVAQEKPILSASAMRAFAVKPISLEAGLLQSCNLLSLTFIMCPWVLYDIHIAMSHVRWC